MNQVTAQLKGFRQSPRKIRVVANLVRGKNVRDALTTLKFAGKRATAPLSKLINSAVANAKNLNLPTESLKIKEIRVDGGAILYRRGSAPHGRAPLVRKRTSHVKITLMTDDKQEMKRTEKAKKIKS